jgi:hypothetical protein
MPHIFFDPSLHQKVRYIGSHNQQFKNQLFVVLKNEHDLESMNDDELLSVYPMSKPNVVNVNRSQSLRQIYKVKKSDLERVDSSTIA